MEGRRFPGGPSQEPDSTRLPGRPRFPGRRPGPAAGVLPGAGRVGGVLLFLVLVGLLGVAGTRAGAANGGRDGASITNVAGLVALNRKPFTGTFPVRLVATCLYVDTNWGSIWLSDGSGISWTGADRSPPWLRAGDRVDLVSMTVSNRAEIDWQRAACTRVATNQFPPVRRLSGAELDIKAGGDSWTELPGIVRRVTHARRHVRAEMIVEGRICEVTLPAPDRRDLIVEETEVRCWGVLVPADKYAPPGVQLKLFVPQSRFVARTHASLDHRFAAPVLTEWEPGLLAQGTPVRIRARLKSQDDAGHLVLTGTPWGDGGVSSLLVGKLPAGCAVDVVGVPVAAPGGGVHLENALYRLAPGPDHPVPVVVVPPSPAPPEGRDPTLRNLEAIRSLPVGEARRGWPVSVEAVVLADYTSLGWNILFVQDASGGTYVDSGTNVWHLRTGDRVRVEGVTETGRYGSNIRQGRVQALGPGETPVPRRPTIGSIQLGSEDARWSEIEAWVRHVWIEDGVLHLEMGDGSGRLKARVGVREAPVGLRDAVIRIRGVVAGQFDDAGDLSGAVLYCPSLDEVHAVAPPPPDPFVLPLESIATLRRANTRAPGLRRARIEGVVTARSRDGSLFVQEGDHAIMVRPWSVEAIEPGVRVGVVGIPYWRGPSLEFRDARVESIGRGVLPVALQVADVRELGISRMARRCAVDVPLVSMHRLPDSLVLDCTSTASLEARIEPGAGEAFLAGLIPGSLIRVTGALECVEDSTGAVAHRRLILASPGDLAVLVPGSRWTWRHAAWVLMGGGTALVGAAAWGMGLRRQVRSRTVELTQRLAERQAAEVALLSAVREKDALLREIHHRVKNNLQIISSLLSLQSVRLEPGSGREALGGTQGRVRAMALLHDALYRSGNVASVDVRAYLESLVQQVQRTCPPAGGAVRCELEVPGDGLEMDQAVPCGLIVHELVTNSFRHAFPGNRGGVVRILMGTAEPGRLCLEVSDDGVGLPPGVHPDSVSSMGLMMVGDLARQLGGELESRTGPGAGTCIRVCFPRASRPGNPRTA